ncbi:hypothetical protein [Sporosarcina sp. FSL W7-1283]|uniref:hypothetical protein n=1 Tax=Sporosarcina sp. FSL W7-1283 TaxID=2921560 RepID=UPI0030F61D29
MLQTVTMLFIIYEITKLLMPESYIRLFKSMPKDVEVTSKEEARKAFKSSHMILFIVEVAYLLYIVILLFTPYWFVSAILIVLMLIYKKRLSSDVLLKDSIASIITMSLVFFI